MEAVKPWHDESQNDKENKKENAVLHIGSEDARNMHLFHSKNEKMKNQKMTIPQCCDCFCCWRRCGRCPKSNLTMSISNKCTYGKRNDGASG